MQKEGKGKILETQEKPKRNRWRTFLITILIIILFFILAWFLLKSVRQDYAAYLIDQAQNANDQQQKALLLYKAKIITPTSAAPYFELGKLSYEFENYEIAQKYFVSALKRDQKNKQFYIYLINSLINQDKFLEVSKYMEKLEILNPNDPEIIFLKARLALNDNQVDEAKELLSDIKNRGLKYETYYALILLSEGNFAIIEKSSNTELNSLINQITNSQNKIFIKARLGLEWLKFREKTLGCGLIKEAKNIDPDTTQKLNTYQKLFNYCNL